jgi:hypothetical protein
MRSFIIAFFIIPILLTGTLAYAHGEGSLTFSEKMAEGHLIDVDYESSEILSGVSGTFVFVLWTDDTRKEKLPYADLWVRIISDDGSAEGNTMFAGPIAKPEFGDARVLYVFPEAGEYRLAVRYNRAVDSEKELSEISAEFPFSVSPGKDGNSPLQGKAGFFIGLAAGAILAGAAGFAFFSKKGRA